MFTHTEVDVSQEGKGVGSALAFKKQIEDSFENQMI